MSEPGILAKKRAAELAALRARTLGMWEELIAEKRAGIAAVCNFRGSPRKRRKVARALIFNAHQCRADLTGELSGWKDPNKPRLLAELAEIAAALRAFA